MRHAILSQVDPHVAKRQLRLPRGKAVTGPRIALYQPDIAGNTGTILRMAACLGLAVDIIEPAGFDLSGRALRRAGMDYLEMASLTRHLDFERFEEWRAAEGRRLVLLTTSAARPYTDFGFEENDILLFGRESAGVPEPVRGACRCHGC